MSEFTHRLPHQSWSKPSRNEEEYFHRSEFKNRMAAARDREARRADDERRHWVAAHGGHCPKCGAKLEEIQTPDGHADQCPNCLGVWIDSDTFARVTHPEKKSEDYLTSIFREMILQYTTGGMTPPSHGTDSEGDG